MIDRDDSYNLIVIIHIHLLLHESDLPQLNLSSEYLLLIISNASVLTFKESVLHATERPARAHTTAHQTRVVWVAARFSRSQLC